MILRVLLLLVSFGCIATSVESDRISSFAREKDEFEDEESPMSNTSKIHPDCVAFVKEFGLRSSRFIKCSVENARPFRFCEGCVVHYERSKTVFQDIVHNDENLDNCRKELLNSDRVQVINSIQKDIDRIWDSADCDQCFSEVTENVNGTVHFILTEKTKQFVELYKNFTECIKVTGNTTHVCEACNPFYTKMNDMFEDLLNDRIKPQHVCMDIVDMMNYTRLTWGQDLNCTNVHKQYSAVLATAICLLVIPVIFYGSLALYATKKTRNFLKQKRLSIFHHTSTYGTLDSPPLLTEEQRHDSESQDSANQSASSSESAGLGGRSTPPERRVHNKITVEIS